MGLVSTKLRNSARGQDCRLQIPGVCSHNPEKVVLCHVPSEFKGMGNKGHDYHGVFGCHECHDELDQHRLDRVDELEYWLRGLLRTQAWWVANGFIVVAGVAVDKPKTRPKKKSKMPSRPFSSRLWRPIETQEHDHD